MITSASDEVHNNIVTAVSSKHLVHLEAVGNPCHWKILEECLVKTRNSSLTIHSHPFQADLQDFAAVLVRFACFPGGR